MGTHNCGCKFNLPLHDYKRSDRRNPALRKDSGNPHPPKKLSFKPPNVNLIQRTMQVEQWTMGKKAVTCIGPRALYRRNTRFLGID
jgi:hypothetical protein